MTEQTCPPCGNSALAGEKIRDAMCTPANDASRAAIVEALRPLSIEKRAFALGMAVFDGAPPMSDDSPKARCHRARCEALVVCISQHPELAMTVGLDPFFSPSRFAAGARRFTIRGPRATGPGASRWPK